MATQSFELIDPMPLGKDMFTATGLSFPSLALCGMLTSAIPVGAATRADSVVEIPPSIVFARFDATLSEVPDAALSAESALFSHSAATAFLISEAGLGD